MSEQPVSRADQTLNDLELPPPVPITLDTPPAGAPETIPPPQSKHEPSPVQRLGRFEIQGEIGRGGMGAVLRGHDPELGRDLALKVLLANHTGNAEVVRRFQEEAQIGGQLQHPGLVPVYELGADSDGRPFFAMKLVKGRTLAALLQERKSPADELPRFLTIFEQTCQTLAYAHDRRVIHRDLKPANVMVGAFGEVQVMDWGLAKVLPESGGPTPGAERGPTPLQSHIRTESDRSASRSGTVLGTPAYMPPEQARGEIELLDQRADVFGLGAILCEILTGQPPFIGRNSNEVLARAGRGDLAEAVKRLDECGAESELVQLAKACLTPAVEGRPYDGSAVAGQVAAYRGSVAQRLHTAELERAAAMAREHEAQATARAEKKAFRRARALAVMGLLAVVAFSGVGWVLWDRAALQAQRRAETERAVDVSLAKAEQLAEKARKMPSATSVEAAAILVLWRQADDTLAQADTALTTGAPDDILRQRVAAIRAQFEKGRRRTELGRSFALRKEQLFYSLDEARMESLVMVDNHFDYAGVAAKYTIAFAAYDLEVGRGGPDDLAQRLASLDQDVRDALIVALDDWAFAAERVQTACSAADLRALAQNVDNDTWRKRYRAAILAKDGAALRELSFKTRQLSLPPSSLVLLARSLYFQGDRDEARDVLRWGRSRHPRDFWLHFELGTRLDVEDRASSVQIEEAIGCFRAALALRPSESCVRSNLGIALLAGRQVDEATAEFLNAVEFDTKYAPAHHNLGRALYEKKRFDEAIAEYLKAIELDPKNALTHNSLGIALLAKNQFEKAIAEFRKAIELDTRYAHAHYNLGKALFDMKQVDEAIAEFRKAIEFDPKNPLPYNSLGSVLFHTKQWDQAIVEHRKSIKLDPTYAPAHHNLGNALIAKKQLDEAIIEYRKAIELDRKQAVTHQNLGFALADKKQVDEAITEFRMAIELDKKLAQAHYGLGNVLHDKKEFGESIAEYRKAIELDPKYARSHYNLGIVLAAKQQLDEAATEFRAATELDPEFASAYLNLGNVLLIRKRFDEAIAAYRKARVLDPKNASIHGALGQALIQTGHLDEAKRSTQQALELLPAMDPLRPYVVRQLDQCDRLITMMAKLPDILSGKTLPADNRERLMFIAWCGLQDQYFAAARLFEDAFSADAKLADDLKEARRYNAARFAALAAAGQGKDAKNLPDKVKTGLRRQTLLYLRADLVMLSTFAESDQAAVKETVRQRLSILQQEPALVTVRDAIDQLPETERAAWRQLWQDVSDLLKRVAA